MPDPGEEARESDAAAPATARNRRGWMIAILGGLAALLVGAIALIGMSLSDGASRFPASAPSPAPSSTAQTGTDPGMAGDGVAPRDEPSTDADEPVSVGCEPLCTRLTDLVGEGVRGADGTEWSRSRGWETLALPQHLSDETVAAEYTSDAGVLSFTVWGYGSDADAEAALEAIRLESENSGRETSVDEDGAGMRYHDDDGQTQRVIWFVPGQDRPWVLRVEGPSGPEVRAFSLALDL